MAENSISLTRKDPNEAAIRRRQKYAEMLAAQGAKDIEVADVGGIPTPISPFQGLAKVFQTGLGSYLANEADKEEADYVDARRKKVAAALAGAPGLATANKPEPMPTAAPATDEYGAPYSTTTPEASAPIVESGAVKPQPRVTFNQKRNYYANMANSDDPDLAEAGAKQLRTMNDSMSKMANVNPKDFTQDSFKNYMDTGEPGDLVAKPTGLKADLYDMFSVMGLSTKDIANSPLAQRLISGFLATKFGLVTEADAADLALKFVNSGVTRAAQLFEDSTGKNVPGMPSQQSAFSITPYLPANISQTTGRGSYTLGQPTPEPTPGAVAQALGGAPPPVQRTAAQPAAPRQFSPPVRTVPMGQPAAVAPQIAPEQQASTAPGVKAWQQKGFVPLFRAPNVSPMEKQKLVLAQPAEQSGTLGELAKLDAIERNIDKLLNEPGFNLNTGLVGSKLPNISSAAIQAEGTFQQLQNQAKAFSVADMKDSSSTGATGLGQITRAEYPMLRDIAARFVAADTPAARREAMLDWKRAINGARGRIVDQYNSTYDPINYNPPPVTTYRSPEADKALSDKVNKYRKGRR
jgi:hypothetical protein